MIKYPDIILYSILPFIISFFTQKTIIALSHKKSLFLDNNCIDKIQSFHKIPTPRAGGIGIFLANVLLIRTDFGFLFFIVSFPAFLAGFTEDFLGRLSPQQRMLFQGLSAVFGIFFLSAYVEKISLDIHLPVTLAVIFTTFAVIGGINSINIIDGLNGLASIFSLIVLSVLTFVAWQIGEPEIFNILILNIFAVLGFLILNFPHGKIFLGDGGAYFLGFLITEVSILFIKRQDIISPFFFLLIMIYPVWEVIFSILRRKMYKKSNAVHADKMHLHQVIYRRFIKSNPIASLITLSHTFIFFIAAIFFMKNEMILMMICFLYCFIYIFIYKFVTKKKKHTFLCFIKGKYFADKKNDLQEKKKHK